MRRDSRDEENNKDTERHVCAFVVLDKWDWRQSVQLCSLLFLTDYVTSPHRAPYNSKYQRKFCHSKYTIKISHVRIILTICTTALHLSPAHPQPISFKYGRTHPISFKYGTTFPYTSTCSLVHPVLMTSFHIRSKHHLQCKTVQYIQTLQIEYSILLHRLPKTKHLVKRRTRNRALIKTTNKHNSVKPLAYLHSLAQTSLAQTLPYNRSGCTNYH